jgi:hypothetical protein
MDPVIEVARAGDERAVDQKELAAQPVRERSPMVVLPVPGGP